MTPCIDRIAFPHILDKVFHAADAIALRSLRATCRELREKADSKLYHHIAIHPPNTTFSTSRQFLYRPICRFCETIDLRHSSCARLPVHPDWFCRPSPHQLTILNQRLSNIEVADFLLPLPACKSVVGVISNSPPRVVRFRFGPQVSPFDSTFFCGHLRARETAVYFMNYLYLSPPSITTTTMTGRYYPYAQPRQPGENPAGSPLVVRGAARHVFNLSVDEKGLRYSDWLAGFICEVRMANDPKAREIVLILDDDGYTEPAFYHEPRWSLSISGGTSAPIPGLNYTIVGRGDWHGSAETPRMYTQANIEFLSPAEHQARVGQAQYDLQTVPPPFLPLVPRV